MAGSDLRVCYDDMYGMDLWCMTCQKQVATGPSLYNDVVDGWPVDAIVAAAADHVCPV